MEFKKYNSIENAYQEDFIQSIREQGFGNLEFVVQEKVHGANLSFITNGQQIQMAKRTDLISEEENFYNSNAVLAHYEQRILSLFQSLSQEFEVQTVTIFGEIFGGGYPHKEVAKDESAKLVQRGIYYCPHNDFYAFDILINHETYLDTETANRYFEQSGFVYAKTLLKGSLDACLAYPNDFKTALPAHFQLPEVEGNICEGVIIRPVQPAFFNGGSRVIIKNKNEKWAENNNYIHPSVLAMLIPANEELSEAAEFLCGEVYKLISPNRLDNLISKLGEVDPKKDYGKLLGLLNKDVLADFFKNHQDAYNALEKHESKAVNKFLNRQASKLLQNHFEG